MTQEEIQVKALPVLRSHGVLRASLFGSAVHGTMTKESDVDILVHLKDGATLLEFVGIKQDLEEVLGKKVDLLEYDAIKTGLRKSILLHHTALL